MMNESEALLIQDAVDADAARKGRPLQNGSWRRLQMKEYYGAFERRLGLEK